MINDLIEKHSPPGYSVRSELNTLYAGLCLSLFLSLGFFAKYFASLNALYDIDEGKRFLRENVKCEDFADILGIYLTGFIFTAVVMLFFMLARSLYTQTASKSIYTLRRLPEKAIVLKYFILMPFLYSIICLLAGFIVLTLYYAIYMLATPNECITAAQWYKIWRL